MSDLTHPIQLNDLCIAYGLVNVVKNLTLEVPRQSVFALLGPNGAGKSTTLFTLVNAIQPKSGTAMVLGQKSTKLSPKELSRIGFVAESQDLPGWLTASELAAFLKPFYPGWDSAFCNKLAEALDIPMHLKIGSMSRGQKMKTALLSSMAYRPELLILDEPFSGLDPLTRHELIGALLEFVGESDWTVLLSSHDVEEVERLSDRVGFLFNGSLLFSKTTDELLNRFRRMRIRLQTDPGFVPKQGPWVEIRVDGVHVEWVTDAFDEQALPAEIAERFGDYELIECQTMSLREIFVVVAEKAKREKGGVR